MTDRIIDNPIINSPYKAPDTHFKFDDEGITNQTVPGRRPSQYFVPDLTWLMFGDSRLGRRVDLLVHGFG